MRRMVLAAAMLIALAAALWAAGAPESGRGLELPPEVAEQRGREWKETFAESLQTILAEERIPIHVAALVLRNADIAALADNPREAAESLTVTARETDRALRRGTPAHVASATAGRESRRSRLLADGVAGPPPHANLKGARDLLRDRTQRRTKAAVPGGPRSGPPSGPPDEQHDDGGPGPPGTAQNPAPSGPPDEAGRPFP